MGDWEIGRYPPGTTRPFEFGPLGTSRHRHPSQPANPLEIHSLFSYFSPPSLAFYDRWSLGGVQNSNSGRIRAQILETLRKLRFPGAQNSNSGHFRPRIPDRLCKLCSPRAQNSNHHPLLLILLPSNRSTRLSSSGSIHKMMISRGRR